MPKKSSRITKSLIFGLTIGAVMLIEVVAAFVHAPGQWSSFLFAAILSLAVGALVVGLSARRLTLWLSCLVGGAIIGLFSGMELALGESFGQEFFVIAATLAFFVVFGLIFGALSEFIRLMHHLLHGRKLRDYRGAKEPLKEDAR